MAKPTYPGPPEALAKYEAAVAALPEVERKGAKNPYTSRNGHMFSFLAPEGFAAVRLSNELRDEFASEYEAKPVEQYGRTMNGYVEIPAALLDDTDRLAGWLARSHEWIGTLNPKPTKKSK